MRSSMMDDRYDIGQVMIQYATSVDQRDMVRYGSCFADDVEVTGFSADPIVGRDAWVAYVTKALTNFGGTHHQITNQEVVVVGESAHLRSYVQATHELVDDDEHLLVLWAIYDDRLARTPEGWKITQHAIERTIDAKKVRVSA